MKWTFVLAILLFAAGAGFGLEITVVDYKGNPLPDAGVAVAELGIDAYTDKRGKAEFSSLPPGSYTLLAALPGYQKAEQTVEVRTGAEKIVIHLNLILLAAEETRISEKRNKGEVTAQTTVKGEDLEVPTESLMNDVAKTLQTMPGVSSSGNTFDSAMYIQGGSDSELVARMDGVYIFNPTRWGGSFSMFNPTVVQSLDLYTAGYPARYLQGLSGILDVKVRDGNDSAWDGFFDLSVTSMEITLEGPLGENENLFFNLRRTWYDFIAPFFLSEEDREGVRFPFLWDGVCKTSFDLTPADRLSFLAYASYEGMTWTMGLADEGQDDEEGDFRYDMWNVVASVRYTHGFSDKDYMDTTLAVTPTFGSGELTNSSAEGMDFDFSRTIVQIMQDFSINSVNGHRFGLGASFLTGVVSGHSDNWFYVFDVDHNWTKIQTNVDLDDSVPVYGALYAMDDWEILPHLILQAGVTADGYLNNKELNIMPRGGLKYEITPELDVFARGGMYNFYPFDAEYLDDEVGNPDLKSSKALHAIGGFNFSNEDYSFLIEGFYKYYYDLPMYDMGTNFNNNGVRHAAGFDVYLQKKASKNGWINGWTTYTFVYAREKVLERTPPESGEEPYGTPEDAWYTPEYVSAHTLSTVLELDYHKNNSTPFLNWLDGWKIALDFRVLSGKPYTPVTGVNIVDIGGVDRYDFYKGEYNGKNMPWICKLDIKLTMPSSLFSLLNLTGLNVKTSSYIDFINVLNLENIYSYYYGVDKNDRLVRKAQTDFPFMVLVGMRAEF